MTIQQAIARAWNDDAYKAKLLSDPPAAFGEVGISVPAEIAVKLKVIECIADTQIVVFCLAQPQTGDLSIDDLGRVGEGFILDQRGEIVGRITREVAGWISRSDDAYKARLLSDPHAALGEAGVSVSAGTAVKLIGLGAGTQHMVLPVAPPQAGDLSLDELEGLVGMIKDTPSHGGCTCSCGGGICS